MVKHTRIKYDAENVHFSLQGDRGCTVQYCSDRIRTPGFVKAGNEMG